MVLVMVNEAALCLDEGVVDSPEDLDFTLILGTGWAPFRGGPLRHADAVGAFALVSRLDSLAARAAPPSHSLQTPPRPRPRRHDVLSARPLPHAMNPAAPPPPETRGVMDTSKMSAGQREALELTESARGAEADGRSFAGAPLHGLRSLATRRALFHAMVRHGPALEKRQLLLGRLVDIGTELFALAATALHADALLKSSVPATTATHASSGTFDAPPCDEPLALVNVIHAEARERIDAAFAGLARNSDSAHYAFVQDLLADRHRHLRDGIV